MTSEIGKVEKYVIISLPVVSILAAGLLFHIMFPNYRDLAGWFQFEMSSIPFILWSVLGAVSGFIVGLIIRLKPDLFRSYSRRIVAGFFGWLLLSVIISSLTEEGNLFDRLAQGPLFKAWAVIFLISISGSPTFLGIVAVMGRKRTAIAGSILMFFMLAASCMVFSQADSAKVISQGPFLSVLFVWSLISFVES
ncbi:MAG: hypothetical protein U9R75_08160, partial [Candidatus Thermoplasmatota archaeon]|nr:hypothetical protein [Candidatus Thermoplasmatota archaeon]